MATINYNGMELEEVTAPQIFDPPREILVWDMEGDVPKKAYVAFVFDKEKYEYPVRTVKKREDGKYLFECGFKHCALLQDPPKPRRATNRELARWLAQGNGECILEKTAGMAEHCWTYEDGCEDEPANGYDSSDNELKVRKWSDTEWHEPDVEYLFGGDDA